MRLSDTLDVREWLVHEPNLGVSAIMPIVASESVTYPYIAYERQSVEMSAWKRGADIVSATFVVAAWSDDYDESIIVAERIIDTLAAHGVAIEGVTEGFQNGAFYQSITVKLD